MHSRVPISAGDPLLSLFRCSTFTAREHLLRAHFTNASFIDPSAIQFNEEDKARLEQAVADNVFAFIFGKGCWHSPADKMLRATLIRIKASHVKTGSQPCSSLAPLQLPPAIFSSLAACPFPRISRFFSP